MILARTIEMTETRRQSCGLFCAHEVTWKKSQCPFCAAAAVRRAERRAEVAERSARAVKAAAKRRGAS